MKLIDVLMIIDYILLILSIIMGEYISIAFMIFLGILTILKLWLYRKKTKGIFLFLGITSFVLYIIQPMLIFFGSFLLLGIGTSEFSYSSSEIASGFGTSITNSLQYFLPNTTTLMLLVISVVFFLLYIIDNYFSKRRRIENEI